MLYTNGYQWVQTHCNWPPNVTGHFVQRMYHSCIWVLIEFDGLGELRGVFLDEKRHINCQQRENKTVSVWAS